MKDVTIIIQEIMNDRGIPKSIRESLEESTDILNGSRSNEERIAYVLSVLEEATNNYNLSSPARTHIWEIMSNLENLKVNSFK